ncbi:hypothetical protein SS37A_18050 [Methylocystis iwaonis]|uniref:Uncharacterized protein n=1 Tax=Methylocystis iwaonis TaxID=2885079 RepID=A0ABN6VHI7_9HYPH|nr:hypothetical protein SS37A_18050 [Methylocystis iwaonis]
MSANASGGKDIGNAETCSREARAEAPQMLTEARRGCNLIRDPLDWFGAITDARPLDTRKSPPSLRGGGADEAIQRRIAALDCFASLAMTAVGQN